MPLVALSTASSAGLRNAGSGRTVPRSMKRGIRWLRCPTCRCWFGTHDHVVLHGDGTTDDTLAVQLAMAGVLYHADGTPYMHVTDFMATGPALNVARARSKTQ